MSASKRVIRQNDPMNPTREELLFQRALTKPVTERAARFDRECGNEWRWQRENGGQ